MEKNNLSRNSSLLVSGPALLLWFVLLLVSAVAGYELLAGLFLFFLLLFSFVRYWASKAMKGVSLEVGCGVAQLFPGMETELEYKLKNNKLLPLVWLELSQQAAENGCVIPEESFESYEYFRSVGDSVEHIKAHKRSFSLVMGYESISLSTCWYARRRGLYRPQQLLLRSGDGFGLSQVEKNFPAELLPEIVVYPKRVPVDGDVFLRQDWEKSYGTAGFREDMSVLRGTRPYSYSDSWKRINWRMAARQPGELSVDYYETVQPASVMFVFDGESYCKYPEKLEESLEILGSMLEVLCSKGVSCGLCLPKSAGFSALCISHEQHRTSSELLYYLAGYDCLRDEIILKDSTPSGEYRPSVFELSSLARASADAGSVALITNSPDALSPALLSALDTGRLLVFSESRPQSAEKQFRLLDINSLRKGGGDEK